MIMANRRLETGASADAHVTKKEHIMRRSDLATFSALSEDWRVTMSICVKEKVSLCSISNADLRNLPEEQGLVVMENLSGKVNFSLADPLYDVPIDQKEYHAEYDVLVSKNMKDMAKVLGFVMKP